MPQQVSFPSFPASKHYANENKFNEFNAYEEFLKILFFKDAVEAMKTTKHFEQATL